MTIKPLKRVRCKHGHFNCLLCHAIYTPHTPEGESKYLRMIKEAPLSDREVVFLKSKVMESLARQIKEKQQENEHFNEEGGEPNEGKGKNG